MLKSKFTKHTKRRKLRCRNRARRCGAKHSWKPKCTKHTRFGPLLEVQMSKKCTPLWHEAHFEVKMYKAPHVRATFGRWSVVLCGRRKGFSALLKVSKTWGFCSSFNCNHHYTTLHYTTTKLRYITLHYTNYTTPHYTPLHPATLHYTQLHYATLHYITLYYTNYNCNYNYITPHYTTLTTTTATTKLLYTTQHKTRLHYTTQHYITLHSLHRHKRNCNHTTLITLHHNYNSTTLQLQLQLNYATIDPAVVGEVTDQVNTATIVTTPKNTTPTTFQSISGFALPSVIHNNQPLL